MSGGDNYVGYYDLLISFSALIKKFSNFCSLYRINSEDSCQEEYMYIKTSCVMTEEVYAKLQEAEKKTGKEVIDLLLHAIRLLVYDYKELRNKLGPVEYQKRFDEETGERIVKHRVKIKMHKLENLLLQDMRRFYFKSISLLFAIAIEKYLDMVVAYYLVKNYEDRKDNYPSGNWMYKEKCSGEATCTMVWWGVPPNFIEEFFT